LRLIADLGLAAIVPKYAVPIDNVFKAVPIESPLPVRTPSIYLKRGHNQPLYVRGLVSAIRQVAAERGAKR
jgi:LysR family cyn operon transcriptional activator